MDSTGHHPRVLLALLGVSCLVTATALVAGLVRAGVDPEPIAPAPSASAGEPVRAAATHGGAVARAAAVLHGWDSRRATAWAHGDVDLLRSLYLPGSRAGERDAAMLEAWVRRGLRVRGMTTQLLRVRVLGRTADRLELAVTDRLAAAVAVGATTGGGVRRVPLPGDAATTRTVVLQRCAGVWRVASVSDRTA